MKFLERLKTIVGEKKDIATLIREASSRRKMLQTELERMPAPTPTTVPGYGEGSDTHRREVNRLVNEIRGLDEKIALLEEKKRHEEEKAGQR